MSNNEPRNGAFRFRVIIHFSHLNNTVLQVRLLIPILSLLFTGCSEAYLTEEVEAAVVQSMGEHVEEVIAELNNRFELLGLDPLPKISDHFALRVIEFYSRTGQLSSTEIELMHDGSAIVRYLRTKREAIGVERIERLNDFEFRVLMEHRGKFENIWDWGIREKNEEEVEFSDGTSWIVEVTESGRRHMVLRSSVSLAPPQVDEEFNTLLDALKSFEN